MVMEYYNHSENLQDPQPTTQQPCASMLQPPKGSVLNTRPKRWSARYRLTWIAHHLSLGVYLNLFSVQFEVESDPKRAALNHKPVLNAACGLSS